MVSLQTLHKNQKGLVSLTVSIIFILVISIVTTSFAFLMRREQRQSLDRQLSTQAFYAAESGLNDAAKAIEAGGFTPDNGCEQSGIGVSNQLDGDTFQYTCLLIDNAPAELRYDDIGVDETTVVKLDSATDPISKIKLSWQAAEGYATGAQDADIFAGSANHDLPNYEVYGPGNSNQNFAKNTGILRATTVPITGNPTRASLLANAKTFFMYPNQSGTSSISYSAGDSDGSFIDGNCALTNSPRNCSAEITNLPGTDVVYLRLSSIYKASSITIEAFNGADEPLQLVDTQYQVDSTGRANDVLRRIQARIPRTEDYYFPEFALETSEGICKRMLVFQNSVGLDPSASGEPACYLNTDD